MTPEDVVRAFVDACWNRGDDEEMRQLCQPDLAGRMAAWAARVRRSGPDVQVRIDVLTTNADGWVATLQTRSYTHTGPSTGPLVDALVDSGEIPATGKRIESQAAVFYRVADGRIVEIVNIADNLRHFANYGKLRLDLPG